MSEWSVSEPVQCLPVTVRWIRALVQPEQAIGWSEEDWDLVVRVARSTRLLARLAHALQRADRLHVVPEGPQNHLRGAMALSRQRTRAMTWTIERLPVLLDVVPPQMVLLKGAAYVAQELPIAAGRLPSDLDILAPRSALPEMRFRLHASGWQEAALDAHDQRYYLEWSHELPPMTHRAFGMELDVHHTLLPPRRGQMIDGSIWLARAQPTRWSPWQVLAPEDQVLHSAAHLFRDPEPRDRLRDIVDLDGLFRHFGADTAFWGRLEHRAKELQLEPELALAVHFATRWLETPVPASMRTALAGAASARSVRRFECVLVPTHPDQPDAMAKRVAMNALLARYHATRLPMRHLLPHLARKWWKARRGAVGSVDATGADPTAP